MLNKLLANTISARKIRANALTAPSAAPPKLNDRPRRSLSGKRIPAGTPLPLTWEQLVRPGPPPLESAKVDDRDVQHVLATRYRKRKRARIKSNERERGARLYFEDWRKRTFLEGTMQAQVDVLRAGPDAPGNRHRYANVYNALVAKYGQPAVDAALADPA